jgi:hypothetical protein
MKGMLAGALSPVEATPDRLETYKRQFIDEVEHLCGGEEVVAAAMFRQGGATRHQAARSSRSKALPQPWSAARAPTTPDRVR